MKTLSITMQINKKTIGIFPDPSFKEKADLVNMAQAIARETWREVELVACVQLTDDALDVEWRVVKYDKDGSIHKLWQEGREDAE